MTATVLNIFSKSVIVTVFNGERWIDGCFESIARQDVRSSSGLLAAVEVCVFDDASTDRTAELLLKWAEKFHKCGIGTKISKNLTGSRKGVGYGRNQAVKSCEGNYLCFQDVDDEMLPERISSQLLLAQQNPDAIIGSRFVRAPENSTCRFSRWANEVNEDQLENQIFTSNGPTVIMPTWFCCKKVFERVGGFNEDGYGIPEDLIFFYKHLDLGGKILRSEKILLIYRYHPGATTFSISEKTIWKIRMERLIKHVLETSFWRSGFTIWNAGKQGRHFFKDLPENLKDSVKYFCDVDKKKINKRYEFYDQVKRKVTYSIPIIHYTQANPPILICMKLFLTNGAFEENLESLHMIEGKDYVIFS